MRSALRFVRESKVETAMLVVVLGVFMIMWTTPKDAELPSDGLGVTDRVETMSEFKKVSEQMTRDLQADQPRMIRMSLVISLILLAGIFIDALFIVAYREKKITPWLMRYPTEVQWPVSAAVKAFIILFFSEIAISLVLSALNSMFSLTEMTRHLLVMSTTFFRNIVVTSYIFVLILKHYRLSLADLGFHLKSVVRNILFGLAAYWGFIPLYFLLLVGIMGIMKLIGYEPPVQTIAQIVYEEDNQRLVFAFGVFIAILGPIFEEILFRGFVYQALRKRWGFWRGLIAVSVIFAVLHAHWVALVPIFALSVVLTLVFEATGSLIPSMMLHMTHNLLALTVLLAVKGMAS